ncbi:reverse transcriptase (RNA-dependent DNA polymerase) domain-containing protein [Phthorimaea operculella]|nr:reverse transcriptase (RNA-dependent DNA polymerase) domain-containing protein [Phthorimaea operculella]
MVVKQFLIKWLETSCKTFPVDSPCHTRAGLPSRDTFRRIPHDVYNCIRDKSYAVGILLDMSKAYDRVQHDILLEKLFAIGIRGKAFQWLRSYLANIKQIVEIESYDEKTGQIANISSTVITTNCSIPQGSVIGRYPSKLEGSHRKPKTKLSQFTYALAILKANTSFDAAISAYFAYAYSWMRYGVILWGQSSEASDIFILQKKCLRILLNLKPKTSCKPYFIEKKLLSFPSIYILEISLWVRKNLDKFNFCTSRRRNHLLEIPTPKLEIFKNSTQYMGAKIYNKIPKEVEARPQSADRARAQRCHTESHAAYLIG